jgi:hypothetical protein
MRDSLRFAPSGPRLTLPEFLSPAPLIPIVATPAIPGVEMLSAEPIAKAIGVGGIGKAKDNVVPAPRANRVPARRQREVTTEIVGDAIVFALNLLRTQRDLMRPIAIDPAARDLAFAAGHGKRLEHFPAKWRPVCRRKCDQI